MRSKKETTHEALLRCEECGAAGRHPAVDWAVAILREDPEADATPDVVFYCPNCAAREFGFIPHVSRFE